MITSFASVDDLLKELEMTKFDYVGIRWVWSSAFPKMISVEKENMRIKDRLFPIVINDEKRFMTIIFTQSINKESKEYKKNRKEELSKEKSDLIKQMNLFTEKLSVVDAELVKLNM